MNKIGYRILVVEDYPANQVVMERFLEPYGRVDLAANGPDAVAMFKEAFGSQDRYDLICLDIMLPRMDGHEVLNKIRATEKEQGLAAVERVKIIMTSALGDSRNIMAAFRGECESYLQKPIRRERLEAELKELGFILENDENSL
ncbi:MAG: response regulator [Spirochaetaceae bacterium]|nr:response regulator [Spirochaetaceae bacterium]MDT8298757.1 response regulator [Spirochaetaceae bacterium]